ncbi:Ribosome assembly protein [Trichinella spiralis]|uniref:Ribosome assembly protein n=1 Tax=Trichinella spiralis TaxID=6334 RepID=A0ABR3K2P9_TRISP
MQQLRHQSPITITNLNVLSGIAERDNGDLITYMLYKWSRDFRKPAYKAGKRAKREHCGGLLGWSELRHDRKHWICGRPGGRKVHAGRPVTRDLTGNSQQERIGDHEPSDVTEIILGGLVTARLTVL